MRLTCPNCNAQYEVDDKVIPDGGRDVQCSACANTWFQYPMEVALQMRAAELEDDDDEDQPPPRTEGLARPGATPRLDKTVLDVLREEAERELGERKRSRQGLETQGDLGLTRPQRSRAAPTSVFGEDEAFPAPAPVAVAPVPAERPAKGEPASRRNLLPDIEELTSTLEPGSDARRRPVSEAPLGAEPVSRKSGFQSGLSVALLIVLALVAVYALAPLIAAKVPALAEPMAGYRGAIDGLRVTVATMLRGLFGG